MAKAETIIVGGNTDGTLISGPTKSGGFRVRLQNTSTTVSCYIGGDENVLPTGVGGGPALTAGLTLGPGQALEMVLNEFDCVYGRSFVATTSITVAVFRTGGQDR